MPQPQIKQRDYVSHGGAVLPLRSVKSETAPLAQNLPGALRPFTPKEFAEAIGGLRSADWVRQQCGAGEIKTISGPGRPPYLIPAAELARFRPSLAFAVA